MQVRARLYGLNLARTLGDKFLKDENVGFSAVPYVSEAVTLPAGHSALLVIASDGLWDSAEPGAVAAAAAAVAGRGGGPAAIADALVSLAMRNRAKDDVTVMAVQLS